jgi:prepilin-type N-terminal cleavage/methylation domain-containing protein/prepilin-type processing-associated H-X9-DG protein
MPRRPGFTLLELLVVIAIVAVLVALAAPAVMSARAASLRVECQDHLRQVGTALHQYHGIRGSLPPGVSVFGGSDPYPYMSWCTRLLPFIEQDALWQQAVQDYARILDFGGDPPHADLSVVVRLYTCPADARGSSSVVAGPQLLGKQLEVAFTDYLGVEGTDQFAQDGALFLDSRVRFGDITDGLSCTAIVGERPPSPNLVLGWWYAGRGQEDDGSADSVLGAREQNVSVFAPGCPRGPYHFTTGNFNSACDAMHFWSLHGDGAHFLFGDGSVHFLNYSADAILPALVTRAGNEPVEIP